MRYVKWAFWAILILLIFGFFHYTLPQRDIVRVTGSEIIRADFSGWNRIFYAQADSGNDEAINRDLRLINTSYPNGGIMVFRNEDTGFGWPPYFKLDSSNLHAEAADLISTRENPRWAVVTHYGWRNEFLSIYPNAVAIREIDDPNVRLIPWFNIFVFVFLGLCGLGIFRLWQRFKRRKIDPLVDKMEEHLDTAEIRAGQVGDKVSEAGGGVRSLFQRWFGKSG